MVERSLSKAPFFLRALRPFHRHYVLQFHASSTPPPEQRSARSSAVDDERARAGGRGGPTNPRLATVVRCGLRALDRRPVLGSTHLDRVAYVTVAGGRAGADPLGTC